MESKLLVSKGADQDFIIPLMDANGEALDVSGNTNTIVILYDQDKNIIAQFSEVTNAAWLPLTIGGDGNNELSFTLPTESSSSAAEGDVMAEVRTLIPDGYLEDGQFDLIADDIYMCTLKESVSNGMTIPVV